MYFVNHRNVGHDLVSVKKYQNNNKDIWVRIIADFYYTLQLYNLMLPFALRIEI